MKYFEKLEEFFQRSIVELYSDFSYFFYVNSFLRCKFIYYTLHEHSIILIKLPLVKRYGHGNGLRSSFWKSIPYSQNFVSNKRKAIHNRIIQTSFRRRKGRVEDKRKEESSEEAERTFAGYQEEKKKVWEIRCHEWTNFLIRAKQRDHTPKSRCPSAISSSIRPNPWKSPRHDPRSTWCVPCSWRRASGSRRIMIGHESKNQETTYPRHLLYAAISRNAKKFDLQRSCSGSCRAKLPPWRRMHLLLLPRGQDGPPLCFGVLYPVKENRFPWREKNSRFLPSLDRRDNLLSWCVCLISLTASRQDS